MKNVSLFLGGARSLHRLLSLKTWLQRWSSNGTQYSEKLNDDSSSEPSLFALTAEDMTVMQKNRVREGLIFCACRDLRKSGSSSIKIEPNIREKLCAINHNLDEFFQVKMMKFEGSGDRPIIICTNIPEILISIDYFLTFSINGKYLTTQSVWSSLVSIQAVVSSSFVWTLFPRRNLYHSVSCLNHSYPKDSGLQQLIILADVSDVIETYLNNKMLWIAFNFHSLDQHFIFAADFKMYNILLGLMSLEGCYPCIWCNILKWYLKNLGASRTIGNFNELFWKFYDSSDSKPKAKSHGNAIHSSLIRRNDNSLIISVLSPLKLHLMIGSVTTLFNKTSTVCSHSANKWLNMCHISHEKYHCGTFKGNDARMMLEKLICLNQFALFNEFPFVVTFRSLDRVISSCFGNALDSDFNEHIEKFRSDYLALHIPVTPKIHCIFYHVAGVLQDHKQRSGILQWATIRSCAQWLSPILDELQNIEPPESKIQRTVPQGRANL